MSEHTKGPWKVELGRHCLEVTKWHHDHQEDVCSVTGYMYADKYYGCTREENKQSNAHLISAAPEMYEALVKAHDLLLCLHVCNEDQHRADKLRASLKDIILKAEGKS